MLIYSPKITNRVEYTFKLIFGQFLELDYKITSNLDTYVLHEGYKLNYSTDKNIQGIFIYSQGLLFEHTFIKIDPETEGTNQNFLLFPFQDDLGFDIFSAVFFMVSRYEEIGNSDLDEFGRYKAINSLSFKYRFLEIPIVNIWIERLKDLLVKKIPGIKIKKHTFKSILTYDIDVAFAFKGRTFFRNVLAVFKDILSLNFQNLYKRFGVLITGSNDPWDVCEELINEISIYKIETIFFFLLGRYSKYNRNLKPDNRLLKELIIKIDQASEVGIHPSFESYMSTEIISKEKRSLESILNKSIYRSRQHYLRLKVPETYRKLIKNGIQKDYSMGYAETVGFRAGICTPYYFYDLLSDEATSLKLYPLTYMEGSLFDYMKLSPEMAFEKIEELINTVKSVNGTFISLWHNQSVSDTGTFKNWKVVHDKMIKKLVQINSL